VSDPIADAAAAALAGELVVLPTDTVYGIGTRPDDPGATARLFEAKGRPRELELPVLVPGVEVARAIAAFDVRAERLAGRFWPGPLTLVLNRTERSMGWVLGGDPSTIGVRVPHHPIALAVLAHSGPLAVTSANLTGRPTPATCEGLEAAFGDRVAVYLCQDEPLLGRPSTVAMLHGGDLVILREGSISSEDLERALHGDPR
jgi:tRNA threonylcarbamoyl adenosine modification protein (Sua5/YciO/YrdC/YwlC family)